MFAVGTKVRYLGGDHGCFALEGQEGFVVPDPSPSEEDTLLVEFPSKNDTVWHQEILFACLESVDN